MERENGDGQANSDVAKAALPNGCYSRVVETSLGCGPLEAPLRDWVRGGTCAPEEAATHFSRVFSKSVAGCHPSPPAKSEFIRGNTNCYELLV